MLSEKGSFYLKGKCLCLNYGINESKLCVYIALNHFRKLGAKFLGIKV